MFFPLLLLYLSRYFIFLFSRSLSLSLFQQKPHQLSHDLRLSAAFPFLLLLLLLFSLFFLPLSFCCQRSPTQSGRRERERDNLTYCLTACFFCTIPLSLPNILGFRSLKNRGKSFLNSIQFVELLQYGIKL